MSEKTNASKGMATFLNIVEKGGNMLPNPAMIFAFFAFMVIVVSGLASIIHIEAIHPVTGQLIKPVNLFSIYGLHAILTKTVTNFTGFAPLGVVLVAMLGIGIAESTGLMSTALRLMLLSVPSRLVTFTVVLAGILSNVGADVGYALVIPLGAIIFLALDRHPLAGLAAAFAGVSGGYSANFLLGSVDPLLAGLSQEAARIIDPSYVVNPACNYYFMFFSTIILALIGTWITEKIVEPRLGKYDGEEKAEKITGISPEEKRGLKFAVISFIILVAIVVIGLVPHTGFLRSTTDPSVLHSPALKGVVTLIFLFGFITGVAYGIGAGTIKSTNDIAKGMAKAMSTLGPYIALVFFAAQFVAYFKQSNLGVIIALNGALFLKSLGLGAIPLILSFVILSAFLNLFMGSASAKWAIMAPVFVPMFMLLGYSPELTQVAYRIGDSCTNLIAPMMSYVALILAFMYKYKKDSGIGTMVATMLPYTISFLIFWMGLLMIWMLLKLPLGPGAPLFLPH
jgi:aminobenzoyl-glutamate transport protein